MNRESIIFGVSGVIIGFLLGLLVGAKTLGGPSQQTAATSEQSQSVAAMDNLHARITELENLVARDPKNLQAWVTLGNSYYDAQNAKKAVEAYARALELKPDDANILTDQGVMFRTLGFYDKALKNFEMAYKVKPDHLQSLFNMGIVYLEDLKQPSKARTLFESVARKGANTDVGRQASEILKQIPAAAK